MMHQPFTREHFTGDGKGAHYRGPAGERDLRVRNCAQLTTHFGRVEEASAQLSRYGGDCYAYCMLAAGHVDLVIETELKPYDVLAIDPDHRPARAASSPPGTMAGRMRAEKSSPPATAACTRRR
jgi:fructose-1,6-bisphosphatase/inositol monophosphatase family enzyme